MAADEPVSEPKYDKVTQASMNGIYVKAQELDRDHNESPAPAFLPPGDAASSASGVDAASHASSSADVASHASDAHLDLGAAGVTDAESCASSADAESCASSADAESHVSGAWEGA